MIFFWLCQADKSCDVKTCRQIQTINESDKSIVYKKVRGRLGNTLNAYTMLLMMRKLYGYDAYLLQESYDILTRMFTEESIEVPVLEKTFCDIKSIKFQIYDGNFTELVKSKSSHANGKMYNLYPPKDKQVFLPEITNDYKRARTKTYLYLRQTMKIKPKLVASAKETFQKVAKKMGAPLDKITFVGIHHRRADMGAFAKQAFNEKQPKKSFFYDAMDYFREEYNPVAFLYVSDDMAWGKKNLKNKHKDLFFVGKENGDNDEDVGHDFALLVGSNHTVTTLGSFSRWALILNGGDTYSDYGPVIRSISNYIP